MENERYETSVDYLSGIYKFFKGKDLEIEFLVKELGKGQSEHYKVPSFGIKAEGLRYTDLLIKTAVAINVKNFKINVPIPQAYLLQKIIINKLRKNKKQKDYLGIENLLENIKTSSLEYQKLRDLYTTLTKKQKNIITNFLKDNLIELL